MEENNTILTVPEGEAVQLICPDISKIFRHMTLQIPGRFLCSLYVLHIANIRIPIIKQFFQRDLCRLLQYFFVPLAFMVP